MGGDFESGREWIVYRDGGRVDTLASDRYVP